MSFSINSFKIKKNYNSGIIIDLINKKVNFKFNLNVNYFVFFNVNVFKRLFN